MRCSSRSSFFKSPSFSKPCRRGGFRALPLFYNTAFKMRKLAIKKRVHVFHRTRGVKVRGSGAARGAGAFHFSGRFPRDIANNRFLANNVRVIRHLKKITKNKEIHHLHSLVHTYRSLTLFRWIPGKLVGGKKRWWKEEGKKDSAGWTGARSRDPCAAIMVCQEFGGIVVRLRKWRE